MHRIALCLLLYLALPAAAMAQQNTGNTKENVEKSDKRANSGGKASQQRAGGVHSGQQTTPAQANKPPQ